MTVLPRLFAAVLPIFVAVALLSAVLLVRAGPLRPAGRIVPALPSEAETPQSREYRAGVQAQIKGDAGAAKIKYLAALKIDVNYAPAMIGLAALAQIKGSTADVEAYLARAENSAPKSPEVYLARARFQISQHRFSAAEESLKKAIALDPKRIPPLIELGDLYLRNPSRSADALRSFQQAVALDARNAYALYGQGVSAATDGKTELALTSLQQAAQLSSKDPAPLRAIGRLHLEANAPEKALAAFDAGLARQPSFLPLMLDRAAALGRMARWADALKQLQVASGMAPMSAEVKTKMGDVYQGAGRQAQAKAAYLEAIALEPTNPLAYNNLAWMTVQEKGDIKMAVAWARQAVALSPDSSPFHDTLGSAERASGNLPAAVASFQRAVQLEPRVPEYHFRLGQAQNEAQQPAAARASLMRALELDPNMPGAKRTRDLIKALPLG